MRKIIIIISSILILLVGGFFAKKMFFDGTNPEEKKETLTLVETDSKSEEGLDEHMSELGYEVYSNSTDGRKYAYIKDEGNNVEFKYEDGDFKEYNFIYIKNFDNEEVSFVMKKTNSDYRLIFSISDDNKTILVEKEVYKDCSVDECITAGKLEINYEAYTYDIDDNKLTSSNENQTGLELKDIKSDLEKYFEELSAIYKN